MWKKTNKQTAKKLYANKERLGVRERGYAAIEEVRYGVAPNADFSVIEEIVAETYEHPEFVRWVEK